MPDITARICGICPVAYQMSSAYALENALRRQGRPRRCAPCAGCCTAASGSRAMPCTSTCSRLPTCSANESALELAADAPEVVRNALRLKKIGNDLLKAIGGRSVHPVNVCVGGFYSLARREGDQGLAPRSGMGTERRAGYRQIRAHASLPVPGNRLRIRSPSSPRRVRRDRG
ncbi:MAG: hypothetical protein MZV64_62695 [Ignavibacteriales bacterium]|nr:hypothetical protein [Ignavibacteriales bacterium]